MVVVLVVRRTARVPDGELVERRRRACVEPALGERDLGVVVGTVVALGQVGDGLLELAAAEGRVVAGDHRRAAGSRRR